MLLDDFDKFWDGLEAMKGLHENYSGRELVRQYFSSKLREFAERLKQQDLVVGNDRPGGYMDLGYNRRNAKLDADIERELAELGRTTHAGRN